MMDAALSKNNFKIRLTSERWLHITEGHSELAGYYFDILDTIENPEFIYEGSNGELLAVKEINKGKFIIVIYKEVAPDVGFVITAFLSKKINYLLNKKLLWKI
ncbi:MAG: hypothetical protein IT281_02590 [Ignavibacteria bacterium]|nr:hypothetical protein [Ignavibacteria bacterium]MCC7158406.1 hypothetical protein [Ignavibacteria bacterium]